MDTFNLPNPVLIPILCYDFFMWDSCCPIVLLEQVHIALSVSTGQHHWSAKVQQSVELWVIDFIVGMH